MVRYSFLLMIFIGFSAISAAKADVCNSEWWQTATVPNLEALAASFAENEDTFPESCGWTTPLHLAVQFSPSQPVVEAFLDITRGAHIDAPNAYEEIPLDLARERLENAQELAEFTGQTFFDAVQAANRGRASKATTTRRQRELDDDRFAAQANNNQAQNEKNVAEAIYELLINR